jgi:hypothetical protein
VIDARESVSSEPSALDLEAIRARHFAPKGRLPNSWKTYEDVKALIAEVERLRPQIGVFGLSRWQQKVLIEQVDLVRAQVEAAHAEAATMRAWAEEARIEISALRNQVASALALGVSLHKAADKGAKYERAAVVAWLRAEVDAAMEMHLPVRAATFLECAEAIERGGHRREETT